MIAGSVVGRWTVLEEIRKDGRKYYRCLCECGTVKDVYYRSLEKGGSLSCGCLRKEQQQEKAMDLTGQRFGKLVVQRRDPGNEAKWICRCDCGRMKSIRGTSLTKKKEPTRACGCDQREFAVKQGTRSIGKNSEKQITLNRELKTNTQVIKTKTPPKNNTSGAKGIRWDEKRGKWEAYIQVHGKRIFLGRYGKREDALKARLVAEETYFEPLLKEAGL